MSCSTVLNNLYVHVGVNLFENIEAACIEILTNERFLPTPTMYRKKLIV